MKLTKSQLKQIIMEEVKRSKRRRGFGQGVPAKGKFSRKQEYFLENDEAAQQVALANRQDAATTLRQLRDKFLELYKVIPKLEGATSTELGLFDNTLNLMLAAISSGDASHVLKTINDKLSDILKSANRNK